MTNTYEITYLIDPALDEAARDKFNADIDKLITDREGAILQSSPTLRRKLAYPIDNKHSVFLRTIHFDLNTDHTKDLETTLRKTDHIVRFTLLRSPVRQDLNKDPLKDARELQQQKKDARRQPKSPSKQVSMEDVEAGIEKALTEEVK